MKKLVLGLQALLLLASSPLYAEKVHIKYRDDDVDLSTFVCTNVDKGDNARRVCYDKANGYMVIKLHNTYYHHCEIDEATVEGLPAADAPEDYYHASIRGQFDCRTHRVPHY
jgi:hypothetical protein